MRGTINGMGTVMIAQFGPLTVASLREPVFQATTCLPIESHDGRRQTLHALVPEKFVVIWVSDIVIPTEPPQFIPTGIEVFDWLSARR